MEKDGKAGTTLDILLKWLTVIEYQRKSSELASDQTPDGCSSSQLSFIHYSLVYLNQCPVTASDNFCAPPVSLQYWHSVGPKGFWVFFEAELSFCSLAFQSSSNCSIALFIPTAVSSMAQYEAQLQRALWYLESYIWFVAWKLSLGGIYISAGNVRLQHDQRTLREHVHVRHEGTSNPCKSK